MRTKVLTTFNYEVFMQCFLFPWVAETVTALSGTSKQMHAIFVDNVRAEARSREEEKETQYLTDMWSADGRNAMQRM